MSALESSVKTKNILGSFTTNKQDISNTVSNEQHSEMFKLKKKFIADSGRLGSEMNDYNH